MNNKHYIWLAVGAFVIGILGIFFIITAYSPMESREIPVTFKVVEGGIGLLVEDRFLHFGHITQSGGSVRKISIEHEQDIRYRVFLTGPVRKYILIEPWQGELDAGEKQNVTFTLRVPDSMEFGEYNGTAHIEIFSR